MKRASTMSPGQAVRQISAWVRPVAALLVIMLLCSRPVSSGVFFPKTFTLGNGLRVAVIENHRFPVVEQMIWYRVGAADETPGLSGIAHLLEHLMFKGTRTTEPGEFSRTVAQIGGRSNAFTSHDYTAYFQRVAAGELETVMKLEADRAVNLFFSDADLKSEREVVLEEQQSRLSGRPSALLRRHMRRALYLNHPYGRPVIGWEAEIRALGREEIMTFYRRHYVPGNAMLIIAGDVTVAQVKRLAQKYFGPMPAGVVPERHRPAEPPHSAPRRVDLKSDRVSVASWSRLYLVPGAEASEDGYRSEVLQVLAELLGGGATGHFYRRLVIERKIAVSAGAWYSGPSLDYSEFGLYATPAPDRDIDTLEAAIAEELNNVLQNGLDAHHLERAKKVLSSQAIYARDDLGGGPRSLGRAFALGRATSDVEGWPDRISAVTETDIRTAVRGLFDERRSVTGRLLPDRSVR